MYCIATHNQVAAHHTTPPTRHDGEDLVEQVQVVGLVELRGVVGGGELRQQVVQQRQA